MNFFRAWSALVCLAGVKVSGETADPVPAPRLAVVITIDQFRGDYLDRFGPYFGEGGFKRMLAAGRYDAECHYRHAVTVTAAGHATILTGVHAEKHGIILNEWIDPATWEQVNAVEDRAAALVGMHPAQATLAPLAPKTGRSPRALLATTVGDQLKLRFGARAKVFAASNKDRSAILLGGKLADAAYWDENGRFVTSRYYRDALPAWVEAFNAERPAEAYLGKTWDRLLAPAVYEAVQGPDDMPGETVDFGYTRTFPKRVAGANGRVDGSFFTAIDTSPFSAEMLGRFVEQALSQEQLGRDDVTDLLCVSFSNLDTIGHAYGPDSHEVMDAFLRLDRVIAQLLQALDREVGAGRYVVVLTADHGVSPLPERVRALRPEIPAGRLKLGELDAAVRKELDAQFGALPEGEYWLLRDSLGYRLRPSALAAKGIALEEAAQVVKRVVTRADFVAMAFTRGELLSMDPAATGVAAMVRRGFHPVRDRDVVFTVQPYFMSKSPFGSQHGTPHRYDTHVPLLWFGAGVAPVVNRARVGVDDIAPTFARLLGVPAPPEAEGRMLF